MFKHPINSKSISQDGLQRIHQHLNSQRLLTNQVKCVLPAKLALHCLHVVHANNKIIIFTDSSAWASKLLFMRQPILKCLSDQLKKPIKNFKVHVLATSFNLSQSTQHQRKPIKPSALAIRNLSQTSDLKKNDVLHVALKKLADTL